MRMKTLVPKRVLDAYDLDRVRSISPIASGLIHQTYKIVAKNGTFVLQRLHPVLATPEIADDFFAVTTYLNANGFPAPECVLTKRGEVLASDGSRAWRMQTFLAGKTFHAAPTLHHAKEAGAMYAELHHAMDGIPYTFRSKTRLHDTKKIYQNFLKTVRANRRKHIYKQVEAEIEFIKRELPNLFLPNNLPKRVIHGDPKISNILFDANAKALAVVDLDTCNRHTILVDLGDAFRSWCGVKEDDPNNRFQLDLFRAAWNGYARESRAFLTARERTLIPKAIGTITLELASRFLTDYFTDSYFGWDPKRYKSRRDHNLARARGQIALFEDIQKKLPTIKRVVAH